MTTAITVATVSWHSGLLVERMIDSVERTTEKGGIRYLIADNTNGRDSDLRDRVGDRCQIIPFDPAIPDAYRSQTRRGSYAHGWTLNRLLEVIEPEFGVFMDPDCLLLRQGWDTLISEILTRVDVIGAPYHIRKVPKYHFFPSPIFFAFRVAYLKALQPDWTPYRLSPWVEVWDQLRRGGGTVLGTAGERLLGQQFHGTTAARALRWAFGNSSKDTGWRVAREARRRQVRSLLFESAIEPSQLKAEYQKDGAVLDLLTSYELFLWEGTPILTHFYGNIHRKRGTVSTAIDRWLDLGEQVIDRA